MYVSTVMLSVRVVDGGTSVDFSSFRLNSGFLCHALRAKWRGCQTTAANNPFPARAFVSIAGVIHRVSSQQRT